MIRLLLQPDPNTFQQTLEEQAQRARGGHCLISSAWLSPGGLALVHDILARNEVRLRHIVTGINRKGTSARALRIASGVADRVSYFLDGRLSGPIFHPKALLLESPFYRAAIVGSANVSRGGFLDNVELGALLVDEPPRLNEASAAINSLGHYFDGFLGDPHAVEVSETVIQRLVEIGAIPDLAERSRNDDTDMSEGELSADAVLGITPRPRSRFQPLLPLPDVGRPGEAQPAGIAANVALAPPPGSNLRFVRRYGLGEANRVLKFFAMGGSGSAGTFEPNFTMTTAAERAFWSYPDRFTINQANTAREWSPRVRLVTRRDGATKVTIIPSARLWTRLRDERETEARFRFANTAAVREAFPTDITPDHIIVIDRVDEPDADYEVRLVGPQDPGYAGLQPAKDSVYEYRVV